jgi:hypothetical protein
MDDPRLTTVMGVGRALLSVVGPQPAVTALIDEYGWDRTLQAMAVLRGEEASRAFGLVWQELVLGEVETLLGELDTSSTEV